MSVYATAKSLQSCPTLRDPIDGSPPGSPVPGILQARALEWVAVSFSNAWKWKLKAKSLSCVWLLATPWTAAYQAPPSMGVSRQEYWNGLPLPSPKCSIPIPKNGNAKESSRSNAIYDCIKKNKTLRNKPTKETRKLYSENSKMMMKEIKEDTNRWRGYLTYPRS